MKTTFLLLCVAVPSVSAQTDPINLQTGMGTIPANLIQAAFYWDTTEYNSNVGNLVFTFSYSCPVTTKVQIVPPSGVVYTKEGPEGSIIAKKSVTTTVGTGGVTCSGFGPEVIVNAGPKVGDTYNPFGKGYELSTYVSVVPGGKAIPTKAIVAQLLNANGVPIEAHLVWGR